MQISIGRTLPGSKILGFCGGEGGSMMLRGRVLSLSPLLGEVPHTRLPEPTQEVPESCDFLLSSVAESSSTLGYKVSTCFTVHDGAALHLLLVFLLLPLVQDLEHYFLTVFLCQRERERET